MNTSGKRQRNTGIEALRGIGIIGIFLYHLFPSVFQGGFLGVPLFFVLSGYLMFVTSESRWRKGTFHIGSYYKKRFIKIFPPLFTMVVIVCCYLTLTHSSKMSGMRQEICSIFLGYNNWWQIQQSTSYFSKLAGASPFTHLWFLAVIVQLYIIWPVLFFFYKKCCQIISGKKMCFLFLLLALLSAGKMLFLYTPGEDPSRVYYGTDTMAFSLLIGIFLGAARQQFPMRFTFTGKTLLAFFSICVLIICILFITVNGQNQFLYQGGMFLISLFFAAIVNIIENHRQAIRSLSGISWLSFLGEKSYGIYLWHYPIIVVALMYY